MVGVNIMATVLFLHDFANTSLSLSMRGRYKMELLEWSSAVVTVVLLLYTNLCRGFTLVYVLSVNEHKHSPARMRNSMFIHYVQN